MAEPGDDDEVNQTGDEGGDTLAPARTPEPDEPAAGEPRPAEEAGTGSTGDEDPDAAEAEPFETAAPENGDNPDGETSAEVGDGDEDREEGEDGEESPLSLVSVVEAVLFAARDPLKTAQIARAVGKRTRQESVREAIDELNVHYLETGRAFEIAEIAGRYQLMSRPEFAPHIMRIYPKRELTGEKEKSQRLTPTALETLAIVAYKQPVTRAEIEHIRGVGCGPVLKALIERDSIRVCGKSLDLVGQPLLYATTESFLAEFGLGSLDELPMRADFLAVMGLELPSMENAAPADAAVRAPEADAGQPPPEEALPGEPEAAE